MRIRVHANDELAHYAKATSDIEYAFPWGWGELEGIANRTDFDLSQHESVSGKNLKYFDQELNEHYFPYVIEPAAGVDRTALTFMFDAYEEEQIISSNGKTDTRTLLHFHPDIAPVQVAVLPLSRNEKLNTTSKEVESLLLSQSFRCQYDDSQSIGRRYRRQDEIGTPLCVTIDFETVENDQAVTIRNRDSMRQSRVPIENLVEEIKKELNLLKH